MANRRTIAWITFNAFLDTDLYIVRELAAYYDISWYIVKAMRDRIDYCDELNTVADSSGISITLIECGRRLRSIKCISSYLKMLAEINAKEPNVIYASLAGAPYFLPVLMYAADKNKVVLAIHNVHVPNGGSSSWFFKRYNALALRGFDYYQTFSMNQYELLSSMVKNKSVYYAPFVLKDYGLAEKSRTDNRITFLNFGNIRPYKRIDVLIEAAQKAYERTGVAFRVIIAGQCDYWDEYDALIRYPELFELSIGRVGNGDIADLFAEADYFVAPYQDIAQSGSSIIALRYNVPIIASRLPAFEEYVDDRITGILVDPANVESLAHEIEMILMSGNAGHDMMIHNLVEQRDSKFSTDIIVGRYRAFLDDIG